MRMNQSKATQYDAAILGGGPAGSSASGFLAKMGYNVVLFEKERFPRYHVGESLLPATTLGILNKLGAKDLIEQQGFPVKRGGTFLWGSEKEPWTFYFYNTSEIDRKIGGDPKHLHSYQVERLVFDDLLLRHAESLGVEVHEEHSFTSLTIHGQQHKAVTVTDNSGTPKTVTAKYVIDASGRNSTIRTLFGERHYDPFFKNIAIYNYFEGGERLPGDRSGNILTVAFKHGWFWYIPLSPDLTSVGLVLGREKYDELKNQGKEYRDIYLEMIQEAPMMEQFLRKATLCDREPYNKCRVDVDYSYIHSQFVHEGIFLSGDAACFIDPVFSSGVHLATYAGYLAAVAINQIETNNQSYDDATSEYNELYRREYMVFHRFLTSFYQMHTDHESYFWEARKVLEKHRGSPLDTFISIVTGTSTTGNKLFGNFNEFAANIAQGEKSLDTLIAASSGRRQPNDELEEAKQFMSPLHDSRKRLFKEHMEDEKKKEG